MSGGAFDYAHTRAEAFAEQLLARLRCAGRAPEVDEKWLPSLSPAAVARLAEIAAQAEHVAKLMHEAELLFSGDTNEASFLDAVAELAKSQPKLRTGSRLVLLPPTSRPRRGFYTSD